MVKKKVSEQKKRYEKIAEEFSECFGKERAISFYSAPGRSEIGGNHTDHNRGCVLAAAVDLDIVSAAAPNGGNLVKIKSREYPEADIIDLSDLSVHEEERETSAALICGICARCKELGYTVEGFDAYTATRVLKGSGLSSSAAFEILIVTIISHLFNNDAIDPVTAAQIGQYAENVYFGKPSGLLDQTASSVGGVTAIDFEVPATPVFEKVNFDLEAHGYALCVVDTGGNHANLTSDYAAIPAEMKAVANLFGKQVLREVDQQEFMEKIGEIRKKVGDRAVLRAMHFFDENKRAVAEANALKDNDFERFKSLVIESGYSSYMMLQNVFACSSPDEQGPSLALSLSKKILEGKGAWRVHGGGFAGTIQAFVPLDLLETYRQSLEAVFGKGSCYVLSIRDAGGTKVEI